MTRLKSLDLLALGFMTFALFLGAGNIIFPPSAGMAAVSACRCLPWSRWRVSVAACPN